MPTTGAPIQWFENIAGNTRIVSLMIGFPLWSDKVMIVLNFTMLSVKDVMLFQHGQQAIQVLCTEYR
jgi:hypothetical protein